LSFWIFSDFHELKIDAIATNSETGNIRICYGEQVRLEAYGGTNFHWTPHDFLDDPYSQNPLSSPRFTTQYTVSVSGACDMTDSAHVVIEVAPRVEAQFVLDTVQACAPYQFTLHNQSTGANGGSRWHLGDGTAPFNSDDEFLYNEYTNTEDSAKVFEIMLVARNQESCRDTIIRSVMLYPEISADFTPSDIIGCHPLEVSFTNNSLGTQEILPNKWDFGDGASSLDTSPVHIFTNYTNNDTTFTTQLVVQNRYYCRDTIEHEITVLPYIHADFRFTPSESCTPYEMEIENASIGIDDYEWDFGDGSPVSNIPDPLFTHTYNNISGATQELDVKLIGTNEEGCSDTLIKKLTIHPIISADFSPSVSIGCDSLEVVFTNNSIGAFQNKWDFGDGASSLEENPTHIFRNLTSRDTVYTVTLITVASNLLCSDTITQDVIVHPYIKANFTYSPSAGCTPHTVNISNQSINVDTYQWNFGDGSPISNTDAQDFTYEYSNHTSAGVVYPLNLIVENQFGCRSEITRPITVYPNIVSDFVPNTTIACDSVEVIFTNLSQGATQYTWDFGDGASSVAASPTHLFRNLTSADVVYNVRLIASADNFLCADTSEYSITIHPYINANFSFSPIGNCTPYDVEINNSSVGVDNYFWEFGDGTNSDTSATVFNHEYVNNTNNKVDYLLRLTATNNGGCSDIKERTVEIYPKVTARFEIEDGCSPLQVTDFNNTSINAHSYNWEFGDGSSSNLANPTHTYVNESATTDITYNIRLTANSNFGCTDVKDTVITIFATPIAQISISDPVGCPPYTVTVTNEAVGYTSLLWNFGEGSGDFTYDVPSIPVQYTNNSSSTITYTTTQIAYNDKGCSDTIQRNTVVYPRVEANFDIASGCHPHLISDFNNTSIGATIFNWDFGDGVTSNVESPTHTFANSSRTANTTYNVTLYAESPSGCNDSKEIEITVYHKPLSIFEVSSATGCSPYVVTINNNSQGADNYLWDFGDQNSTQTYSDATFTYDYYNSTDAIINYPINLISFTSDGCSDTITRNAIVYPDIKAQFSAISGCHPHTITDFENTSIGAANYLWDFGDGITTNEANPTHEFINVSNTDNLDFTIKLIATSINNCKDSLDTVITVYPKPFAQFDILNPAGCSPHTINIDNQSVGGDSLVWNFGDGSPNSNLSTPSLNHIYQNATGVNQRFNLLLEVFTDYGCSDTISRNSVIYSDILTAFEIESGCHPHTITDFRNTTIGADIYSWTFGDEQSSNEQSPTHTFNNFSYETDSVYQVKLVAESIYGCIDSLDTLITIYPKPYADFSINNTPGCSPYNTEFTNLSIGADSISWNFGDDSILYSMNRDIEHLYNNPGPLLVNFPAQMFVFTTHGCSDTIVRNAAIYPDITAEFFVNSGCDPLVINDFQNTSIGVNIYKWTFGDNETSSIASPSHTYRNYSRTDDSVYTVRLETESIYGCKAEYDTIVTVYHKPQAEFEILNSPICSPDTVFMNNLSIGENSSVWDFGDNTTETTTTERTQSHFYQHAGELLRVFPITLTVSTDDGCTDVVTHGATVYPDINAEFSVSRFGCSPHNARFINTSTGATQYQWNLGDRNTTTQTSPRHTYHNYSHVIDSIHNVTLITRSNYGCTDTAREIITVFPNPKSEFAILNSPGCSPYGIQIQSMTEGAATIYWDYGDDSTDFTIQNTTFIHNYNHRGDDLRIFPIEQITITQNACRDTITKYATIYPDISSEFTVGLGGCNPLSVQTTNNSFGQVQNNWNFGDGALNTSLEPAHTYHNFSNTETQQFTISLETVSKFGCKAFSDTVITVYPIPLPVISVTQNDQCSPSVATITNSTIGGTEFEWDLGDGSDPINTSNRTITHTYRNTGRQTQTFQIRLVVTNEQGCKDTTYEMVSVHPEVVASFTGDFVGCSPHEVNFINTSDMGLANYFEWELVPGTTNQASTPDHFYVNTSREVQYNPVRLIARSQFNCIDMAYDTIVVYPSPIADFDPTPIRQVFPKSTSGLARVDINDKTNHSGFWQYNWDFGDGNTSDSAGTTYHNYETWNPTPEDRFRISLRVEGEYGCSDTISRLIYIASPAPEPRFTTDTTDGCPPLPINFYSQSSYVNEHHWDFGDGKESTEENPIHIFRQTGTYKVTYTVTGDGGSASISKTIIVHREPIAYFDERSGKTVFEVPRDTTRLINLSSFAVRYDWNFGDGYTSNLESPSYLYSEAGDYIITLTAYSEHECVDEFSYNVSVIPLCNMEVPDAFTPAFTGPTDGNILNNDYGLNDVFMPAILEEGIEDYRFEIYNKWGEKIFFTDQKVVGWDGYYNGDIAPLDVYTWKINATCYGRSIDVTGNVTLLK
jgi:PKD repeat protein